MSTKDETPTFLEKIFTDEMKLEVIRLAYNTCPDIQKVDQEEAGGMMGALVAYGMFLGLTMAREKVKPSETELQGFLAMYPAISMAVETSK